MNLRKALIIFLLFVLPAGLLFSQNGIIKTRMDSLAYSIGASIGKNLLDQLKRDTLDRMMNLDIMITAFTNSLHNKPLLLEDSVMMHCIMTFQQEQNDIKQKKMKEMAVINKKKSDEYMAQNKEKKDVITTPSGLQYKIIKQGDGPKPDSTAKVRVHYTGKTTDGHIFDSSIDRGKPEEFPVTGVIRGWIEALQMMPKGSRWQLIIPPNLGYGEAGAGSNIGPNEVLIFDVELLDIIKDTPVKAK